jgi:hypothetical protein
MFTWAAARAAAVFKSNDNGRQNAYYVPELEMVIKRYRELESEPTALKVFVNQQKAVASQMMKVSMVLINCLSYIPNYL